MSRMSSWTGLFGSRSPKRRPDARIRWFGKLPTYADYYSSGAGEDWVVEFNDWLLEGFEIYLRAAREARTDRASSGHSLGPIRLPVAALILRLPRSGMTVFASIQDYGGDMVGRPFPLCFYVAVPTPQWPGPTSDRLADAARVVRELMGLRSDVAQFLNAPGGFKSVFDDREVDLAGIDEQTRDDSWVQEASRISMADWFAAAEEELRAKDLVTWLGRVSRWGESIAALESDNFGPTLSFPLACGISLHLQTAGWIRWLESRMRLGRRTLSLFLTGGPDDQVHRLTVIAHDPRAEDFLLLTSFAGGLRYVDDLSRTQDHSESAPPDPLPAGAGERGTIGSWADFVQAEDKLK